MSHRFMVGQGMDRRGGGEGGERPTFSIFLKQKKLQIKQKAFARPPFLPSLQDF